MAEPKPSPAERLSGGVFYIIIIVMLWACAELIHRDGVNEGRRLANAEFRAAIISKAPPGMPLTTYTAAMTSSGTAVICAQQGAAVTCRPVR